MVKVSKNFYLYEFKGINPDNKLLFVLQALRDLMKTPITITDSIRTPREHFFQYKTLEQHMKIKTIGNGLGEEDLNEVIPWGSRHLAKHGCSVLRAVDFVVWKDKEKILKHSGNTIENAISDIFESKDFQETFSEIFYGIGVGKTYVHLDIDRTRNARWDYSY